MFFTSHLNSMIIVCGLPATGKSTIAKAYSHALDGTILRTDLIRSYLFRDGTKEEVLGSNDPLQYNLVWSFNETPMEEVPQSYKDLIQTQRDLVYEELLRRTQQLLEQKETVILDGTFSSRRLREELYGIAQKACSDVFVVECQAPRQVVKERIEARKACPDDASNVDNIEIYDFLEARYEPPELDLASNDFSLLKCDTYRETVEVLGRKEDRETITKMVDLLKEEFKKFPPCLRSFP